MAYRFIPPAHRDNALEHFCRTGSVRAAARAAGLPSSTVSRWTRTPRLLELLRRKREMHTERARVLYAARLRELLGDGRTEWDAYAASTLSAEHTAERIERALRNREHGAARHRKPPAGSKA